jgi:hypothetical protein
MGSRRLALLIALVLAIPVLGVATPPVPAVFHVGAAVTDISPPPGMKVYSGGFGQSPPLTYKNETEPNNTLTARAVYISNGAHAISLVTVDSQGIFAAVQEADQGTSGLGSVGMRIDGAKAITAAHTGPAMTQDDIIVQGTHSHSAPTSMGIWGPVPEGYLRLVHDRVVQALKNAAAGAQPAHLEYATIDAPYLDNINPNQTDSYEGWAQDGQVSILRATRPDDGATILTYANVPAHPDIVNGAGSKILTADYFGYVRYALEQELGGTSIVAGATLGREESPVQVGEVEQMRPYGRLVAELLTRALAQDAHPITDATVASHQTFIFVPVTNPLLAALNYSWRAPAGVQSRECADAACPINRSILPPYAVGGAVGTPVTALRVGPVAYVSLNGEAFPEVRHAIASAVHDAGMIVGLSLGNDQLGYYEPAFAWAFANGETPYHSDHLQYNVSPLLGDEVIQAQVLNLRAVGFSTSPIAVPKPENNDYTQMLHPGVQLLASPFRSDAGPSGTADVALEAICGNDALQSSLVDAAPAITKPVHVDFGDGQTADIACNGRRTGYFTHTYAPGSYHVQLTLTDDSGDTTSWPPEGHPEYTEIDVYPWLTATIDTTANPDGTVTYAARTAGGQGTILSYRWTFADGTTAFGATVTRLPASGVSLVATDGTGTMATASV